MPHAAHPPSCVDPNQTLEEAQSLLSFLHESISASEKKYSTPIADAGSNPDPAGDSDPLVEAAGEGGLDESELSDEGLAKLLEELEAAEIVAQGVEGRLDGLLDSLEGMLNGLEGSQVDAVGAPPAKESPKATQESPSGEEGG
ncbi:hypothetical protein BOTBODRAFT_185527 [Botryobasidium botryosum FD-172 SS1]|uniref:Uncharacterized protein n=1 Tax=Botryobasidium botryosum (strain FD-172 SS1) TaxID=930990 RepID=A0A067N2Z5_BOTB1|nr:hypothetical protein BOTBODRAFT_185527 [Botryobasidium botryosum FD-172 SS1]